MNATSRLDQLREDSLARFERAERGARLAFAGATVVEVALLAAFLLLADFGNRTHVLLLIGTVGGYTIVAFGLLALGAHVSRSVQLVLRALELLRR